MAYTAVALEAVRTAVKTNPRSNSVDTVISATPKLAHDYAIRHRYVITTGACRLRDSIDFDRMTVRAGKDCRTPALNELIFCAVYYTIHPTPLAAYINDIFSSVVAAWWRL